MGKKWDNNRVDDLRQNNKRPVEPIAGFCVKQNDNKIGNQWGNNKRVVK